jgi:transcriptional regulator with XRE-family HTH domain
MEEYTRLHTVDLANVQIDPAKLQTARGKLTRHQVAVECDVGYTAIYNIETGRNRPTADLLAKLCVLYNVDVRDLLVEAEAAA